MPEMKAVPCRLCRATMGEVRPGFPQVIGEIEQVLGIPLISDDKALDLTPMRLGIAVCSVHEESIVRREIPVHLLPPCRTNAKLASNPLSYNDRLGMRGHQLWSRCC